MAYSLKSFALDDNRFAPNDKWMRLDFRFWVPEISGAGKKEWRAPYPRDAAATFNTRNRHNRTAYLKELLRTALIAFRSGSSVGI